MKKTRTKNRLMSKLFLVIAAVLITFGGVWAAEAAVAVQLPESGQEAQFYSTQCHDDLTRTYSQAIGSAKESVLMIIYSLNDNAIIAALKKKAEEGVPVKVIYDKEANSKVAQKLGQKVTLVPIEGKGLMHQKIVVIDNHQVWVGTANMTNYSLRIHGNLVIGVDSPDLAAYLTQYADTILAPGLNKHVEHKTFSAGGQQGEMWLLPDNKAAIEQLLTLIDSAQKTVKVAMFTWTRQDLAQAILRARLRGVTVSTAFDHNSSRTGGSSHKIAQMLFNKGIPVIVNNNEGLLHYKTMIIDDKILVNGSANWTKAAFTQNRDCFMILYDLTPPQQKKLETLWKAIQAESKPLAPRSRSR